MSRLVLDTNALIQSLPSRSRFHDIWESFLDGRNYLCITNEILEEYEEILTPRLGTQATGAVLDNIVSLKTTIFITPYFHYHLITADPDDNKFVDCAVAASAKFIVTEDHHYNVLKEIDFPKIDIINLDDYLALLKTE